MALGRVDRNAPLKKWIPLEECGYMFPNPDYFAVIKEDKRAACVAAWLYTRPARCGQMLHPFQGKMPVANATAWRRFFGLYALRDPDPVGVAVKARIDGRSEVDEHFIEALETARTLFGPELIDSMSLETSEVGFHNHVIPVVAGRAQNMSDGLMRMVTWELAELSWRYELLALDRVLARECWCGEDQSSARMEMVQAVFVPDGQLVWWNGKFPTVNPAITDPSVRIRLPAVQALRRLMFAWTDCSQDIKETVWQRPMDVSASAAKDFEQMILLNYCHTFFVHFGRPPIIPRRLPRNPVVE